MSEYVENLKCEGDSEALSAGGESRNRRGTKEGNVEASNVRATKKIKKEKRLAMNRESARARRRRQKLRLDTLEHRSEELSQRHHELVLENQGLRARLDQLEAELFRTRSWRGRGGSPCTPLQQTMMPSRCMGSTSSASLPFGMSGSGAAGGAGGDAELRYMQMRLMPGVAGGSGRTARLSVQDLQPNLYPSLDNVGGFLGGQLSEMEILNRVRFSFDFSPWAF